MAHVSTSEQGGVTSVSTQLSQEFFLTLNAGATGTTDFVLTRGAPRVLVHANQTIGAAAATVTLQASISDDDAGAIKPLTMRVFLSPLATPITLEVPLPAKFCRVSVTAPAGNGVTIELALMAAQ